MDENFQAGKEGLKYAATKNLPVIIMEPLQGGKLAKEPPKDIKDIWNMAKTKRTPAEWGLKWVFNHSEVSLLLSGMNSVEQINENIAIAKDTLPNSLTEKELALIDEVKKKYRSKLAVNCTDCRYCMPCPNKVWIPYNFEIYNNFHMYETTEYSTKMYSRLKASEQGVSSCIECGNCEIACPQHIPIIETLKKVHTTLNR